MVAPTTAPLSASTSGWWDDLWTFDSLKDGDGDEDNIGLEELSRALHEAARLASHPKKQNKTRHSESNVEPLLVNKTIRVIDDKTPGILSALITR